MNYHVEFDLELKKNNYGGLYIVLEGIDGSGKTTQVENLYEYFESQGKEIVKTKEPTREGSIGELVHQILQKKVDIPRVALQYLFAADRQVHLETKVIPALKEGKVVISDRCFWSSLSYGLSDMDEKEIKDIDLVIYSLLSLYHQFLVPDFTLYLDISVKEAMDRISKEAKVKEIYEKREALEKVYEGYQWLLKKFPEEFAIIDGGKDAEEVKEEIIRKIKKV